MKAIDLINRSMRGAGILGSGEIATSDEANDSFLILNDMLDSWSVSKLFVYQLLEENFPLVIGQAVYLMGPGGDFNTTRPTAIQSAYVRLNGIDYDLEPIDNDAYSAIALKTTIPSIPQFLYYDPKFPAGEINLWPNPSQAMSIFIQTPRQLTQFPDLVTDISFPPGYAEALRYALIVRLSSEFNVPLPRGAAELEQSSIARLQTVNSNAPVLRPGYSNRMNGRFNINKG